MICPECGEEIVKGEMVMPFNNDTILMHYECGLRGIIGSVAHLQRRCSCYVPGSEEGDPPGMSKREAAKAAVKLWDMIQLKKICWPKGSEAVQ
jgi:hypothetical protein